MVVSINSGDIIDTCKYRSRPVVSHSVVGIHSEVAGLAIECNGQGPMGIWRQTWRMARPCSSCVLPNVGSEQAPAPRAGILRQRCSGFDFSPTAKTKKVIFILGVVSLSRGNTKIYIGR